MRQLITLPLLYFCFAVISLGIIASIAPQLVFTQFIYFLLGAGLFTLSSILPLSFWRRYHWVFYLGTLVALVVTLMLGVIHKGAARWIPIGPINFQPSQSGQPLTILTLSFFLNSFHLKRFQNVLVYGVLILLPWILTFLEPNLSTSLIFLFFAAIMAIHADIPVRWIVATVIVACIVFTIGWFTVIKPYQKQRVLTFFSPDQNQAENYNARQSLISVGSGGLWGRGLGHGVQSQLRFLPERQTDFIFASIAEELGLFGSLTVLFLYGLLFFFLYSQLSKARSVFFQSLFVGFLAFFCIQVSVNVGMNIGLLPITGITLPFISYGGSSLLSFALSFGILERAVIENERKKALYIR